MADTIAGRYTLIDPIARGGSGSVWRAWDGRLQQLCAAKVLRQRDSADLLRFAREQSVKLEHPHVLAPYGWAAEDAHVVIAMPLVHGGTLESALLDNGAASAELTEEVLAQLLQALQFVHAQGWVHRDVKPGNLMLDSTGTSRPHVFLSDFGIAVRVQDARLTRTGTVVGTPGYLPPEAYALTDPSPAQDLYAAGITALRMLDPSLEPQESLGPNDARAVVGEQGDLAEHLAALLTPDPALRRDAAVAVLHELTAGAARRRFDPARTRDGEPFEVFDVLDPLPEPWASRVLTGWDGTDAPERTADPAGAGPGSGAGGTRGERTGDPFPDGPDTVDTGGAGAGASGTWAAGTGSGGTGHAGAGSAGAGSAGAGKDGPAAAGSGSNDAGEGDSGPSSTGANGGRPGDPGATGPGDTGPGDGGSGPGRGTPGPAGAGAPVPVPGRDGAGHRPAAGRRTGTFTPTARTGRRRRGSAVRGVFVVLVGMTALLSGYLLLDPLGSAEQVPAPGPTPTATRSAPTPPGPAPEETPVVLERVCEDQGGGEERCYFRVP
ncbi:protein kinase domain-containing protein [Kocuria sp. CH-021]|uniref:serine/threonine-protein kinase n=1 Tax=Kocuria sp. CH-021 TaxID=3406735 RepID=UPI003C74789C